MSMCVILFRFQVWWLPVTKVLTLSLALDAEWSSPVEVIQFLVRKGGAHGGN